jgi:hypothetical protein
MSWLVDLFRELIVDADWQLPVSIALAISSGTFALCRYLVSNKYPRYMLLAAAGLGVGLTVLDFNLLVT